MKMVLEMKFQDKTKSKRCIKMIVGRRYCYKGKGIYSGTCSMECGYFPNVVQVKSELHFAVVVLYLMFIYYRKRLSSLMH